VTSDWSGLPSAVLHASRNGSAFEDYLQNMYTYRSPKRL